MAKMNVFTYDNLVLYDELLKGYIAAGDAKALKTVAITDAEPYVLKFYTEEAPGTETEPAFSITLPQTDLTGITNRLSAVETKATENATAIKANADAISAINNADTGILAEAKKYTDEEIKELAEGAVATNTANIATLNGDEATEGSVKKAVKDSADAINATIGTVESGKTVVEMISDAKTAATYDDTQVKADIQANANAISALDGEVGDLTTLKTTEKATVVGAVNEVVDAVEAHKNAIDGTVSTLVGDDTGKSVRTIANEELAAQLLSGDADADFQTLQELAAWLEAHPEDASAMNLAIENLEKLVGTIPEGATATTIVAYIQEAVAAEKSRAEGVESGLDTRLQAVESALGEGEGSVEDKIATAKQEAIDASKEYADGLNTAMDTRVQAVEAASHTHDNKTVLDGITAEKVTAWDGYDAKITANATAIDALEEKVGDGFESITNEQISALFTTTEA